MEKDEHDLRNVSKKTISYVNMFSNGNINGRKFFSIANVLMKEILANITE